MPKTALVLFTISLLTHPGGLDSNGGHHDRRTGGYHYHSSPATSPVTLLPPQMIFPLEPTGKESYRREARTTARLQAREEGRTEPNRETKKQSAISVAIPEHEFRTWSDITGKFTVVGRFAGYTTGRVRLIKKDETAINVDVEILSDSDKTYLRSLLSKYGHRPNF